MWYFSWILGLGLAVGFGIINGLWHEFNSPSMTIRRGNPARVTGRAKPSQ
jgi:cyd operon protein YbgT